MPDSESCPICGELVLESECKNCGYILYDEFQCSNCGYYDTEKDRKHDVARKKVVPDDAYDEAKVITAMWTGYLVIFLIIPYLLSYAFPLFGNALISIIILGYVVLVYRGIESAYEPEETVVDRELDRVKYECNECGYRWSVDK